MKLVLKISASKLERFQKYWYSKLFYKQLYKAFLSSYISFTTSDKPFILSAAQLKINFFFF